jgi:phytoene/squalene synthetase
MCLHWSAMKRAARRAPCRSPLPHLLRIGLLASIEPANCDVFSSRASLPAPGKSRLRLTAAWRL